MAEYEADVEAVEPSKEEKEAAAKKECLQACDIAHLEGALLERKLEVLKSCTDEEIKAELKTRGR